jgi:hypothetical protein
MPIKMNLAWTEESLSRILEAFEQEVLEASEEELIEAAKHAIGFRGADYPSGSSARGERMASEGIAHPGEASRQPEDADDN